MSDSRLPGRIASPAQMTDPCLRFVEEHQALMSFARQYTDVSDGQWNEDLSEFWEIDKVYEHLEEDHSNLPLMDDMGGRLHGLKVIKERMPTGYDYFLAVRDYFLKLTNASDEGATGDIEADIHALMHIEDISHGTEDFYYSALRYFSRNRDLDQFDQAEREQIARYESRLLHLSSLVSSAGALVRGYQQAFLQMLLTRSVDNFNRYIEDLRNLRAFDASLFQSDQDEHRAKLVKNLRNCIVHNRAIVDGTFVDRQKAIRADLSLFLAEESDIANLLQEASGDVSAIVGKRIVLDEVEVLQTLDFFATTVCDIDQRVADRFGLPQFARPS